mmetsp:Transcript_6478/g.19193  ORF Transcript_6478/g.19193 Transcript_6478/m.19193 type:complete len:315 (+) Transcript_6478:346-1290(+)
MALSTAPAMDGAGLPAAAGAPARCPARSTSSTARGRPPVFRSLSEQRDAACRKVGSLRTRNRASRTSALYCLATAPSVSSSPSGRSMRTPTLRASALREFTTWSPNPGQTTTGVASIMASVKLFCPPCVRNTSTPALSMRCWSTKGRHTALGGTDRSPKAPGCGPKDTTSSTPSSAEAAPKASKAPPHAARQSCWPVKLLPPDRPSHPFSEWSDVTTVPMLAKATTRPDARACWTAKSPGQEAELHLPLPFALAPSINNGPTHSKRMPSRAYALANSSGNGSCKSAHVVTSVTSASKVSIFPAGCGRPWQRSNP